MNVLAAAGGAQSTAADCVQPGKGAAEMGRCVFEAGQNVPPGEVMPDRGSDGLLYARSVHAWAAAEASEVPQTSTACDSGVAGGSGVVPSQHQHVPAVGSSCDVQTADSVALWSTVRQLDPAEYMSTETSEIPGLWYPEDADEHESPGVQSAAPLGGDGTCEKNCVGGVFAFPTLPAAPCIEDMCSEAAVMWWGGSVPPAAVEACVAQAAEEAVELPAAKEACEVPAEQPVMQAQTQVDDQGRWERYLDTHADKSVRLSLLAAPANETVQITVVPVVKSFKFTGTLNGHPATFLVDSGCEGNVIGSHMVQRHGIKCVTAAQADGAPLTVKLADGRSPDGPCRATRASFRIGGYKDWGSCLVTDLCGQDVILGMPWLKAQNPMVDWQRSELRLRQKGVTRVLFPGGEKGKPHLQHAKLCSAAVVARAMAKREPVTYVFVRRTDDPSTAATEPLSPGDSTTVSSTAEKAAVAAVQAEKSGPTPPTAGDTETAATTAPSKPVPRWVKRRAKQLKDPASLLAEYPDVYAEVTSCPEPRKHHDLSIDLHEPGTWKQYPNTRGFRYSPAELAEMRKQVQELIEKGLIVPSSSPFGAPVLFVKKKDGSMRMCIDYRRLNAITVKNAYPVPMIDQLLDQLHGGAVMSCMDAASAYHQLRVREGDEWKTAFHTPFGLFEWKVITFGLCNAPSTFQRWMHDIFRHLPFVLTYLDDIIVVSKSVEEHEQHLRVVLDLLRKHKLRIKLSKCKFFMDQVDFLGHVVSKEGITMDPAKLQAVHDWPEPSGTPAQCKSALRSFLGLANYYRRLIKEFAHKAAPLHALCGDTAEWEWGTAQRTAFQNLKDALTSEPVFIHAPDPARPFIVHTDASDVAMGAVLSQRGEDGAERVVAYMSHKFNPAQTRYPVHDREMLAVITALGDWRHYLLGATFDMYTDNKAVSYFFTQPCLSPRQARWVEKLSEYTFNLHHMPGKDNVVADGLSRRQDYEKSAPLPAWRPAAVMQLECARYLHCAKTRHTLQQCKPVWLSAAVRPTPAPTPQHELNSSTSAADLLPVPLASLTIHELGGDRDWLDQLKLDARSDRAHKGLFKAAERGATLDFTVEDGLLYYTPSPGVQPRLCVPLGKARVRLLFEVHDANIAGHLGRDKMVEALQRHYYWPRMFDTCSQYIQTCDVCRRNNSNTRAPLGLYQSIPSPDHCWEQVTHDLITCLPTTKRGHDSIVVFVDRLSKRIILVPTTQQVDAEGYAKLFFEQVFRHFGMPKAMISDRDPRFTSHFWTALCKRLGTNLKMSTAHHAQTDGQTERANRTVEDMLRAYVAPYQDDWDEHLVAVEFAYNNSLQASTKFTPFYLNYGRHPHTPLSLLASGSAPAQGDQGKSPAANAVVGQLQQQLAIAKHHLNEAQLRQTEQANRRRRYGVFKVGDLVLLSTAHLNVTRPEGTTHKLAPRYCGPFEVTKVVSEVAYKLQLPPTMKCHNVFHISLLREYTPSNPAAFPGRPVHTPPPPVQVKAGAAYFKVERIVSHYPRKATSHASSSHYLIKWEGYPMWENTKEPAANIMADVPSVVADYWARAPSAAQPPPQQEAQPAAPVQSSAAGSPPANTHQPKPKHPVPKQRHRQQHKHTHAAPVSSSSVRKHKPAGVAPVRRSQRHASKS